MTITYKPETIAISEDFVLAADESNPKDDWFPEFPDFKLIRSSTFRGGDYIVNLGVLQHRLTGELKLVQSYDNGLNDCTAVQVTIPQDYIKFDIVKLSAGLAVRPTRIKDHYAYFQNPSTKEEFLFDWNTKDCFKLNIKAPFVSSNG